MSALAVTAAVEESAVGAYIARARRRDCADLIRSVISKAWRVELSHAQATQVLNAAGVGILETELEWATEWLDVLESPRARAEAEADDAGYDGPLDEATDRLRTTAQGDLDSLIDRLVRDACGVSVEVAVLACINILTSER